MSGLGAVIQAGGEGRRLRSIAAPKALAPLLDGTLLDWQLDRVSPVAAPVVVIAHHGAEAVSAHVAGRGEVIVEPAPLGTAGGLSLLPTGPEAWLVVNVDHVSDVALAAFVRAFEAAGRPPCLAALSAVAISVDEGVVDVTDGRLTAWRERPVLRLPVTTGLYLFRADALRDALAVHGGGPVDMPALVEALMPEVVAWHHPGWWIDAGTPERLARAAALASGSRRSAQPE